MTEDRIALIIRHEREAAKNVNRFSESADTNGRRAAELICQKLAEGTPVRELAEMIGRTPEHVVYMRDALRLTRSESQRKFFVAYKDVKEIRPLDWRYDPLTDRPLEPLIEIDQWRRKFELAKLANYVNNLWTKLTERSQDHDGV